MIIIHRRSRKLRKNHREENTELAKIQSRDLYIIYITPEHT